VQLKTTFEQLFSRNLPLLTPEVRGHGPPQIGLVLAPEWRLVKGVGAALAAVAVLVAGCTGASSARRRNPAPESVPASTETDGTVKLQNDAVGPSGRRIATAVADLKSVALWHPLTDHLYVVQIQSRPGTIDVPDDGHLADALLQGYTDEGGAGGLCSIMFFPAALRRYYHRVDVDPDQSGFQAPPIRAVWASILAHELGHCFKGQPGERVATIWELRALRALSD
jgi:hypothetical protein